MRAWKCRGSAHFTLVCCVKKKIHASFLFEEQNAEIMQCYFIFGFNNSTFETVLDIVTPHLSVSIDPL